MQIYSIGCFQPNNYWGISPAKNQLPCDQNRKRRKPPAIVHFGDRTDYSNAFNLWDIGSVLWASLNQLQQADTKPSQPKKGIDEALTLTERLDTEFSGPQKRLFYECQWGPTLLHMEVIKVASDTQPMPNYHLNIIKPNGVEYPFELAALEPYARDKSKQQDWIHLRLLRNSEGTLDVKLCGLKKQTAETSEELLHTVSQFVEAYFLEGELLEPLNQQDSRRVYQKFDKAFKKAGEGALAIFYDRRTPTETDLTVQKLSGRAQTADLEKNTQQYTYELRMPLSFFTPEELDLIEYLSSEPFLQDELIAMVFQGTPVNAKEYNVYPVISSSRPNRQILRRVIFEALNRFFDEVLTRPAHFEQEIEEEDTGVLIEPGYEIVKIMRSSANYQPA